MIFHIERFFLRLNGLQKRRPHIYRFVKSYLKHVNVNINNNVWGFIIYEWYWFLDRIFSKVIVQQMACQSNEKNSIWRLESYNLNRSSLWFLLSVFVFQIFSPKCRLKKRYGASWFSNDSFGKILYSFLSSLYFNLNFWFRVFFLSFLSSTDCVLLMFWFSFFFCNLLD